MIKPATLWALFKQCEDSQWLGTICRALGGQSVELDFGQSQLLNVIKADSGWMDERIEAQREKWRRQKRGQRGQFETTADSADKSTVRECPPPSIHPSVHPSSQKDNPYPVRVRVRACDGLTAGSPLEDWARAAKEDGVYLPMPDLMRKSAMDRKIPVEYVGEFLRTMRDCGWEYLNRGAEVVRLNQRNFPSVLKSFYDHRDMKPKDGGSSWKTGLPPGMIYQQENYDASKRLGI